MTNTKSKGSRRALKRVKKRSPKRVSVRSQIVAATPWVPIGENELAYPSSFYNNVELEYEGDRESGLGYPFIRTREDDEVDQGEAYRFTSAEAILSQPGSLYGTQGDVIMPELALRPPPFVRQQAIIEPSAPSAPSLHPLSEHSPLRPPPLVRQQAVVGARMPSVAAAPALGPVPPTPAVVNSPSTLAEKQLQLRAQSLRQRAQAENASQKQLQLRAPSLEQRAQAEKQLQLRPPLLEQRAEAEKQLQLRPPSLEQRAEAEKQLQLRPLSLEQRAQAEKQLQLRPPSLQQKAQAENISQKQLQLRAESKAAAVKAPSVKAPPAQKEPEAAMKEQAIVMKWLKNELENRQMLLENLKLQEESGAGPAETAAMREELKNTNLNIAKLRAQLNLPSSPQAPADIIARQPSVKPPLVQKEPEAAVPGVKEKEQAIFMKWLKNDLEDRQLFLENLKLHDPGSPEAAVIREELKNTNLNIAKWRAKLNLPSSPQAVVAKTPVPIRPKSPVPIPPKSPAMQDTNITIFVPAPDRETCMKQYIKLKELGKGSFGQVLEVCKTQDYKDGTCQHKYALKITNGASRRDLETSKRDPFFLRQLANEKLDGQYIVPRLYDAWLCKDKDASHDNLFVVMDRWDSDMKYFGNPVGGTKWFYSRGQLLRMFRLAARLGQLGIAHGDDKLDQYLERNNGQEIVITDFGFAGGPKIPYAGGPKWPYIAQEGWTANLQNFPPKCPPNFTEMDWDASTAFFPIYENLMQLEAVIMYVFPTYIQANGTNYRFGGIKDLNRYDPKYQRCPGWADAFKQKRREIELMEKDIIEFTLAEIIPKPGEYSSVPLAVVEKAVSPRPAVLPPAPAAPHPLAAMAPKFLETDLQLRTFKLADYARQMNAGDQAAAAKTKEQIAYLDTKIARWRAMLNQPSSVKGALVPPAPVEIQQAPPVPHLPPAPPAPSPAKSMQDWAKEYLDDNIDKRENWISLYESEIEVKDVAAAAKTQEVIKALNKKIAKQQAEIDFVSPITILVPTPDRPTCMGQYVKMKQLGKGSFGQVMEVCKTGDYKDGKCAHKYALKITQGATTKDLSYSKRDPYFLKMLADETLDGQYVVPRIYDAWLCHDQGEFPKRPTDNLFVVMDRWDGDIESFAHKAGGKKKWIYTRDQLLRMFRLAARLGQLGIAHGDAKPNQFLVRFGGDDISITDFGFSGGPNPKYPGGPNWLYPAMEGWSSMTEKLHCPPSWTTMKWDEKTAFFPIYENLIQLESYIMLYNPQTYVRADGKEYRFAGIKGIDRSDPRYLRCTSYPLLYKAARDKIDKSGEEIVEFALDEIIPKPGDYFGTIGVGKVPSPRLPLNQWDPAVGPNPI